MHIDHNIMSLRTIQYDDNERYSYWWHYTLRFNTDMDENEVKKV